MMCYKRAWQNQIGLLQPRPQALRFSQGRGERLVMSRKGPWEGYRRQAKRRVSPVVSFPPSSARERETSGYEADPTRFSHWTAINNFERDKGSTRRKKTAFGLSVPTIFVWDCSSIDYLHRSARWTRNNARQLWNTRFSFWSLFSFLPVFLYSYCWPCWSCACINTYFKLKSGVLFCKKGF